MEYSRSIIEIIKERSSRRSYTPQPVEAEKLGALSDCFAALEGPFGGKARFVILDTAGRGEGEDQCPRDLRHDAGRETFHRRDHQAGRARHGGLRVSGISCGEYNDSNVFRRYFDSAVNRIRIGNQPGQTIDPIWNFITQNNNFDIILSGKVFDFWQNILPNYDYFWTD